MKAWQLWGWLIALGLWQGAATAQIKVGQTAGFTGPVAAGVKEITEGAKLYLDAVNAKGGVAGQPIELLSLDDNFKPERAAENAKKLIDQGVVALFLTRGTPHSQAILPLLAEHKLPLIGPSTGAMALHQPVNPWVYNVRATYQREAERAVQHLASIGMQKIAIIQVDDPFGADAAIGALKGFKIAAQAPVLHEKYNRSKPDFSAIVPKVVASQAQAVMFIGSGDAVVDGVNQLRTAGSRAQLVTLSNNASTGFVKSLKDHARGTIVSQVFPYERSLAAPIVKEAHDLAVAKGLGEVSPAMLEGFAAAKVLVEGLRRAGKDASRSGLQRALDSMNRVDIGGLEVSYSPSDHTGLVYSELSIVGADGRFKR
ncbi:ABC transporter substrate-binding protein [Aquincola sp. S2]|uniref:ABC transporter substrate-binding protein n=1 Tax=Pseudaquabacterium terrae TaxID=2732868 RepID=A0ABX2ETR0_9BURK|nr:ABC transporter substrate-binding protein [Aquabacterium terrae]NRF71887.1 ABC transporter substrate-binding protein [Aquabacterium terrae]